jgi:hypothetical protein
MEEPLLIDLVVSPACGVELGQDVFPAGVSFRVPSRLDQSGAYKWSLRGTSRVCPSTGDVTASGADGLEIANSQKYVDASSQCDPRAGTASSAGRDSNGVPTPRLRQTGRGLEFCISRFKISNFRVCPHGRLRTPRLRQTGRGLRLGCWTFALRPACANASARRPKAQGRRAEGRPKAAFWRRVDSLAIGVELG